MKQCKWLEVKTRVHHVTVSVSVTLHTEHPLTGPIQSVMQLDIISHTGMCMCMYRIRMCMCASLSPTRQEDAEPFHTHVDDRKGMS